VSVTPSISVSMNSSKPSLVNAVRDIVINEMLNAGTSFSAFDVTLKLRDKVKVDPSIVDTGEVGTVWHLGKKIPKINHEDVRVIVHELFDSGTVSGWDRVFNGSYIKYEPKPSSQTANQN